MTWPGAPGALLVASDHADGGVEAWSVAGASRRLGRAALPYAFALALHPTRPVCYAVTSQQCRIATMGLPDLEVVHQVETGESLPCWVEVDGSGSSLAVAHYEGERVTLHELAPDGTPRSSSELAVPPGVGPRPDRQDRPHPHQASFRTGDLWVSDLGTDRLIRYPAGGGPAQPLSVRPGSGPRHFTWLAADRLAVVDELTSSLSVYAVRGGELAAAGTVPIGAGAPRRNHPSDLARAGHLVYVANRGADSVAVVDVAREPRLMQEVAVGSWPQNLLLMSGMLVCAVRDDHRVVALRIDAAGRLGPAETLVHVERPAWVAWSGADWSGAGR